jgi:hypothetical protein
MLRSAKSFFYAYYIMLAYSFWLVRPNEMFGRAENLCEGCSLEAPHRLYRLIRDGFKIKHATSITAFGLYCYLCTYSPEAHTATNP